MGGASISRIDAAATAFPHRSAQFVLQVTASLHLAAFTRRAQHLKPKACLQIICNPTARAGEGDMGVKQR